jgi:hypothetical protein
MLEYNPNGLNYDAKLGLTLLKEIEIENTDYQTIREVPDGAHPGGALRLSTFTVFSVSPFQPVGQR